MEVAANQIYNSFLLLDSRLLPVHGTFVFLCYPMEPIISVILTRKNKTNALSQTIFIIATILAPSDVLQYFTGSTGTVSSFNFALQAPSATAVRQLAYQKYKIGYRSEVIGSAVSCFLFSVLIHESSFCF